MGSTAMSDLALRSGYYGYGYPYGGYYGAAGAYPYSAYSRYGYGYPYSGAYAGAYGAYGAYGGYGAYSRYGGAYGYGYPYSSYYGRGYGYHTTTDRPSLPTAFRTLECQPT